MPLCGKKTCRTAAMFASILSATLWDSTPTAGDYRGGRMSSTIGRAEQSALSATARRLRTTGQREHQPVSEIATTLRTRLALHPLEAYRLAYGWSRRQVVEAVGEVYRAADRATPGMTESMLCRWERYGVNPDPDYARALAEVFAVSPRELGLGLAEAAAPLRHAAVTSAAEPARCYARPQLSRDLGFGGVVSEPPASLSAVRDSLALTLTTSAPGDADLHDQLDGAVAHYDRTYSQHPPGVLAGEVAATRGLVANLLTEQPEQGRTHLLGVCGWLSALLGNLAYHQGDDGAATTHLATALRLGTDAGDRRLQAWTRGAQAMLARSQQQWHRALDLARDGYDLAATPLQQAQLLAWAQLPAQAHLGQQRETERSLHRAEAHLEHATFHSGRFGMDAAEFHLHVAESAAALGDTARAREHADLSASEKIPYGPGWVAARLTGAQTDPDEAAETAADVLTHVTPARLRATSRRRLQTTHTLLSRTGHPYADDLGAQLRALPPA
jgi:transcriptional regulator with XRE-family HTH domain